MYKLHNLSFHLEVNFETITQTVGLEHPSQFTGQLAELSACLQPLCSSDCLEFVLSTLISVINRVSTVLSQLIGVTAE